jgi:signal transduction histidine kinase
VSRSSLARRLLASSLLWIALLLLAGGAGLSYAFRRSAESAFDVRLEAWLHALVAALPSHVEGAAAAPPSLGDPRFERPLSGWYWQVLAGGEPLATSRSLWDATLVAVEPVGGLDDVSAATLAGPRGESLRVLARDVTLPGRREPLRVILAGDEAELRREIERFDALLFASLGALGLGMLALVATQMRLALRPLHALAHDLGAVRAGLRERVTAPVPHELGPLVDSLNELLAHDAELVQRSRDHSADLAHALKTPLSLVWAEAEEIGGERGDRIVRHADTMRRHIERRLAAAAPRPAVAGGRTAVRPVLEAIASTLARLHPTCAIAVDAPAEIAFRGAREDLEEVVGNVLENACKWARGEVRVTLRGSGAALSLEIDDDGPGLVPSEREAVLERGKRLDERTPGSGLGLAIVREVVDLHGGELELGASPLGGLRVRVRLPAAGEPAVRVAAGSTRIG